MMNDDTISRQNVLRCLTDISYNQCKTQGEADVIDIAKTMVITMPSAQPDLSSYSDKLWRNAYERGKAEAQAEIIRCRDCKHFMKWRSEKSAKKFGQEYECECGRLNIPKPDDFCSRAKRKDDEKKNI